MSKTIHDLPKIEKPREKLIKYGPEKLSNEELLAIILRTGKKGKNVIQLSKEILKKFEDKINNLNFDEVKQINGLGPAKVCEIIAVFELGKRYFTEKHGQLISHPQEIWVDMKDIRSSKKEHFVAFFLDSKNQTIKKEIISIGTLTKSLVHPREVFEPAVQNFSSQIILAHNHPSNNLEPSIADLQITQRLKAAGKILGIDVIDHIIVGKNGYWSMKEQGNIAFD